MSAWTLEVKIKIKIKIEVGIEVKIKINVNCGIQRLKVKSARRPNGSWLRLAAEAYGVCAGGRGAGPTRMFFCNRYVSRVFTWA
jgi:hypothetical protein